MCKTKYKSSLSRGFTLAEINVKLGSTKEIESILDPCTEEEDLLREIMDANHDSTSRWNDEDDPIVDVWTRILTEERRPVFFEEVLNLDVAARVVEENVDAAPPIEPAVETQASETPAAEASVSEKVLKEGLEGLKKLFVEMIEKTNEKFDGLDSRMRSLESKVESMQGDREVQDNVRGGDDDDDHGDDDGLGDDHVYDDGLGDDHGDDDVRGGDDDGGETVGEEVVAPDSLGGDDDGGEKVDEVVVDHDSVGGGNEDGGEKVGTDDVDMDSPLQVFMNSVQSELKRKRNERKRSQKKGDEGEGSKDGDDHVEKGEEKEEDIVAEDMSLAMVVYTGEAERKRGGEDRGEPSEVPTKRIKVINKRRRGRTQVMRSPINTRQHSKGARKEDK